MNIPLAKQDIIQSIKDRLKIQDVVAEYVPNLKRRGRRLWACCPLHGEKTPSFMVDTDKQVFHCYGCGKYGDVIDFVAKMTSRDNADTIRYLMDELGISKAITPIEKEEMMFDLQQKKNKQKARDKLEQELYLVFLCLSEFEKSCYKNLKTYEDYKRYPASAELLPVVSWLLDEYLTFDIERQIAVWRYVKGGNLSWLLTY